MKPEAIRRIVGQATTKGAAFRLVLTNGKSFVAPNRECLRIWDDFLGVAESINRKTGLPRNPTFLDPKEVAEVEILRRKVKRNYAKRCAFAAFLVLVA